MFRTTEFTAADFAFFYLFGYIMVSPVFSHSLEVSNHSLEEQQNLNAIQSTGRRLEEGYIFNIQNGLMQYLLCERIFPPLIVESLLDLVDGKATSETRETIVRFLEAFQMPGNLREEAKVMIEDLKQVIPSNQKFPQTGFQQISLAVWLELYKFIGRKIKEKKQIPDYCRTLFRYSVMIHELKCVRLDPNGQTARHSLFHWAEKYGCLHMIQMLIKSLHFQANRTTLSDKAKGEHLELVQLLSKKEADVMCQNSSSQTAEQVGEEKELDRRLDSPCIYSKRPRLS